MCYFSVVQYDRALTILGRCQHRLELLVALQRTSPQQSTLEQIDMLSSCMLEYFAIFFHTKTVPSYLQLQFAAADRLWQAFQQQLFHIVH